MTLVYDGLTGFPIFSTASLIDIIKYLDKLKKESVETSYNLHSYKQEVEKNQEKLDDPDDISGYIEFFLIIIENYSNEIERLSLELKSSFKEPHLISFEQLYNDCINVDKHYCKGFKSEHINKKLKDEEFRYLVDYIYADTSNLMYSFRACMGIKRRLEALVGTKIPRYDNNYKINIKPQKKLRPNQLAKKKCREIAKRIWEVTPKITIADMINHQDLLPHTKRKDGSLYTEKTVRNWINDLCPDRSRGRRKST